MTREELNITVNEYFTEHLGEDFWTALTEKQQKAAVKMALSDVQAQYPFDLANVNDPDSAVVKAIAEQALHLAQNYEELAENKVVTGESAEGVSNSFSVIGDPGIGHRAAAFIDQAKEAERGKPVRFFRG